MTFLPIGRFLNMKERIYYIKEAIGKMFFISKYKLWHHSGNPFLSDLRTLLFNKLTELRSSLSKVTYHWSSPGFDPQ